tara:strand:- start:344 stop:985 length:642 start_codon:yes stop_codon:yes gene_type:complete
MNDVLITPASRKIEFKDSSSNIDAKIETDTSGNLSITNAGGDIGIGNTATDLYIGNGTANVDIIFEAAGEIRGATGINLTLGQSDSNVIVNAANASLDSSGNLDVSTIVAGRTINAQTGTSYTFVIGDRLKIVTLNNSSPITLTIPPNSSVAFAVGTSIDIIQLGSGQVTVAGGSGVTVNSTPTLKLRAQYSVGSCLKIATNQWIFMGDLATS